TADTSTDTVTPVTLPPRRSSDLSTTATVSVPTGDTTTTNNTATDIIALTPQSDLRISKTDNGVAVVPGQDNTVVYTIVVTNDGPSTAASETAADTRSALPRCVTH